MGPSSPGLQYCHWRIHCESCDLEVWSCDSHVIYSCLRCRRRQLPWRPTWSRWEFPSLVCLVTTPDWPAWRSRGMCVCLALTHTHSLSVSYSPWQTTPSSPCTITSTLSSPPPNSPLTNLSLAPPSGTQSPPLSPTTSSAPYRYDITMM